MTINLTDWGHTAAQRGWGPGWPGCAGVTQAGTAICTAARSGTRMSWHRRIARLAQILMDETERRGFLLKPAQCGAFNCRPIAGTKTPSNHSWAIAGDLNWNDNPYTTSGKHTIPDWVRDLWKRYGFANGAMYSGAKDWMHHEFMGTPADADAMTALAIHEILGNPDAPVVPIIPPAPTSTITWIEESSMSLPVLYQGDGTAHSKDGRGRLHWYVMSLQALLNVRGVTKPVAVDGVFGASTTAAVKEIQARQKITADGAVGPATWPWILGNDAPDFA